MFWSVVKHIIYDMADNAFRGVHQEIKWIQLESCANYLIIPIL